ncbi:phosphoglycerate mutase-like protein AT74 isoform X2 [Olea europaea var. sylvestris]|uniref:phosphoglycerate mutase-like protein AT74 isoform X2 n=1 Tax=Olea europaea var. sylvestris TaxID=158386 RepID=UPI000C1D20AA|nr:phosphoglycerate mutase-like protein AT74 isoform X2 [Olea europaea var. sylvestris]
MTTKLFPTVHSASSSPVLHRKQCNFMSVRCCEDSAPRINHKLPHDDNDLASFPEKIRYPPKQKPPRPRRIILVRHGQSEGNVDECVYTRVADPKIRLTQLGILEAEECGRKIREMIEKDGAEDWKDQEQMKIQKAARKRYGRFFYRFPNGESAADVYDRITGFRETLRSDIDIGRFQPPGQQSPNMNIVIVSHGLTLRVFLMRWYKWTVEQFEGLHNMGNGEIIVMEKGYGGRYSLLMHQTVEELKKYGLTDAMLIDQEWQKFAKPGELNYDSEITGPSYFTHFGEEHEMM